MDYRLPSPTIHQILVRSSRNLVDSDLTPCVIGPLRQVMKSKKITGLNLEPTTANPVTVEYLGLKPQAVIHQTSIFLTVKNAVIKVKENVVAGDAFVAGKNEVKIPGAFTGAQANDVIVLTESMGSYTIMKKIDNDTVALREFINATSHVAAPGETAITFNITRILPEVKAELTATYGSKSMTVTSIIDSETKCALMNSERSECFLNYVADRKDLTGIYEINSLDQLQADMDIDPLNPLGYTLGVLMPLSGGNNRTYAFITPDDSDLSYLQALEDLESKRDVYGLVAMKESIAGALKTHAVNESAPEYSIFRNAFVTGSLVKTQTIISATCTKA